MNLADSLHLWTTPAAPFRNIGTEAATRRVAGTPSVHWLQINLVRPPICAFDGYDIGIASTRRQFSEVRSLVERMYSWRGYQTTADEPARPVSGRVTLNASNGERCLGTLTVALDSAQGLTADGLYQDEIDALRKSGRRLCEFTRFAVDAGPTVNSKAFLARLIHVAFAYAHLVQRATDMVIEINPRHVAFYRRSLGFRQVGPERMCPRVEAPAVLMHIDLFDMAARIRAHGGTADSSSQRTLYPHFLSNADERAFLARMRRHLSELEESEAPASALLPELFSGHAVLRALGVEMEQPLAA